MEPTRPPGNSLLTPSISHDSIDYQTRVSPRKPPRHPSLPHPQFQSAPTLLQTPTTPLKSTPLKRKAALTGLHQPVEGNASAGKHRRASAIVTLIAQELAGAQHICLDFVDRFILPASGSNSASSPNAATTVCPKEILRAIIAAFKQSESSAGGTTTKGTTIGYGIRCAKFNQKDVHVCYPPTYTNRDYAEWFCRFANAVIQQHTFLSPAGSSASASSASSTTNAKLEWRVAKNKTLKGTYNNDIRPDFVLTWHGVPLEWRSVLIVGEHESTGSTRTESLTQLATYAEQVFLAQPFRIFVFGLLTSNAGPKLAFWRFDRSGAIGSVQLNYSTSNRDLLTVVSALSSFSDKDVRRIGFHVDSIS